MIQKLGYRRDGQKGQAYGTEEEDGAAPVAPQGRYMERTDHGRASRRRAHRGGRYQTARNDVALGLLEKGTEAHTEGACIVKNIADLTADAAAQVYGEKWKTMTGEEQRRVIMGFIEEAARRAKEAKNGTRE